jgi:hypothetical protein
MSTLSHSAPPASPKLLAVDHPALRAVFATVLILVGLVIAYLSTQEDIIFSTRISLLVGYLIGIPILISSNYDRSIMLMFMFASVAGLLKYKTEFNPVVHVTIDIMMGVICLGWFLRRFFATRSAQPAQRTPLSKLIAVFVVVCIIQIFHPYSYSYVASLAALKMHIFMVPLYFFGFHYFRSPRQIRQWSIVFVFIGIIMSIVAIQQFRKGPEQMKEEMPEYAWMIDQNTWQDETGRSFFRPMSTTANAGGASTWMQCIIPLTLAVCMSNILSKRLRFLLIASLVVFVVTLFISLIRQMFIVTAFGVGLMLFLQFRSGKLSQGMVTMVIVTLLLFGSFRLASDVAGTSRSAVQELVEMLSNPFSAYQESRARMLYVALQVAEIYPLGTGLGRSGPAAAKFSPEIEEFYIKYGGPRLMPSENYFLVMLAETGILGTLIITLITLALLWKGYRAYRLIQDNNLKWFAAGALGLLFSIFVVFFGGPALVTAPLNMYFWFMGGILLKLPLIDAEMRNKTATAV